ncbi:MAG: M3 family oligoendopeptidase [Planctomycetota bacterium]|nr:M3 family oligoendopeptidase [Planctomycetota bacterium]
MPVTFHHYSDRPATLTAEFLSQEFDKLTSMVKDAEASPTSELWLSLIEQWNDLKAYVIGEGQRRSYRLTKDMNDEAAEDQERIFREDFLPVVDNGNSELTKALLGSKHSDAISDKFGAQLIKVLDIAQDPMSPVNTDLRIKEGDISKGYDKLRAHGEVEVLGETVTLAQAKGMTGSEVPERREAAFRAYRGWFVENRTALADIYDKLVKNRHEMATRLGDDNFISLGYKGMSRIDYGPEDVVAFRAGVKKYITPVYKALMKKQAEALGVDTLKPWDLAYDPLLNLGSGVAKPISEQLEKAGRVFQQLSPKLAAHFERMREEKLIDLENRKGKAAGAYCTSFPDEQRVAIFCNSVGDQDDVSTLMHEMGHAFQGWESQAINLVDLRWPSSDACEVHSMGMEFLSQRFLSEFFKPDDLQKFCRYRWRDAISLICYVCVVDEFQHFVYENPEASPDERDAKWNSLYDEYIQGLDWSGAEEFKAARWYAQLHIFKYPFYYIDYAIAELGAMQLSLIDAKDHDKGMETYLELCRLGGTKGVLELFKGAGMRSPFDPEIMKDLMDHAMTVLDVSVE